MKLAKHTMSTMRKWILALCVVFAGSCHVQAQAPYFKKPQMDISDSMMTHYSSLRSVVSFRKTIPGSIDRPTIYALSFFPELQQTKISFRLKKSRGGIISTRPTMFSVFRRSAKRKYLVIINDSVAGRQLPLFKNAPVNGQVGILGHELNHIVYFSKKSGLGLIWLGIMHISTKYIDRFEFKTDQQTISRGLGHQLYSWKQYLDARFRKMRGAEETSGKSGKMKQRYMSLEEIKEEMNSNSIYR